MSYRASRICGCGYRIAHGTECPCEAKRNAARRAAFDARRPSARERGYNGKWEQARKEFLLLPANRYCTCGCGRRADVVDHIVPHKGNKKLFWDRSNWQPMAYGCHASRKQSQERRDIGANQSVNARGGF